MLYTAREEVVFEPKRVVSRTVYLFEKIAGGSLGNYYVCSIHRANDIFVKGNQLVYLKPQKIGLPLE